MNPAKQITPHPQMLEQLFLCRKKVLIVFEQLLKQYQLDHISVTSINESGQLLALSSTPAIEFNLFSSSLWQSDQTYHPDWFRKECFSHWESLYDQARYNELYHIKQLKHHFLSGISTSTQYKGKRIIFSMASYENKLKIESLSSYEKKKFLHLGLSCTENLRQELWV